MCDRPQDLLRHRTEQAIEPKDRVRIDHSTAIRMGTANPVVDEVRFGFPRVFVLDI
ncbi:hypothetical protein M413DRAFT_441458 [Hebeloma cylindrosporum]|uniref:Uncharacterized protein n=1 Tax=Hebeloma cylindrosporum TaxID=76867 RepID=A0A0C3CC45_HEBCY|nr:hypothetical protein M413DRAFT_441458 [Hebeloma cylindrosporum h7]